MWIDLIIIFAGKADKLGDKAVQHQLSVQWFETLNRLEDTREGEAAFREKRKPHGTGR
ncbi:MAG: hypothetical protein ABI395_06245 [Sphingobium sp.]